MALRDCKSDTKILNAAIHEFAEKGYNNASLRKIAQKADVTTGAIYIRYKNKDELFCALTKEITEVIERDIVSLKNDFYNAGKRHSVEDLIAVSSSEMNAILDLIYDHYKTCYLLFCCAEGSSMENYTKKLVTFKVNSTMEFFRTIMANNVDIEPESLTLIIESEYNTYISILRNRYDKQEAKKYLKTVISYFIGGWKNILDRNIKEN